METQLALLPHSGGETSREAAEAMAPTAAAIREQVFRCIARCGSYGATRQEIEEYLGYSGDTVRPRVWELQKTGRVVDSGERRLTSSGRKAEVLVVHA